MASYQTEYNVIDIGNRRIKSADKDPVTLKVPTDWNEFNAYQEGKQAKGETPVEYEEWRWLKHKESLTPEALQKVAAASYESMWKFMFWLKHDFEHDGTNLVTTEQDICDQAKGIAERTIAWMEGAPQD